MTQIPARNMQFSKSNFEMRILYGHFLVNPRYFASPRRLPLAKLGQYRKKTFLFSLFLTPSFGIDYRNRIDLTENISQRKNSLYCYGLMLLTNC